MEGILIAIISGLFTLAGVWLSHYLAEKRSAKTAPQTAAPTDATSPRKAQVRQKADRPSVSPAEVSEEFVFFKRPSWWILAFSVLAVSAGAGFFVRWVVEYGFGVLNVPDPDIEASWIALGLGGLAWGLVYVLAGSAEADDVVECLFALFDTYDDLFSPGYFSDFVRASLSALPINLLLSWIAAIGLGILAATQLGANLAGVSYLVFGGLTFVGIVWFLSEELA